MMNYQELKASLSHGDEPALRPLWACVHDTDRVAAKELLWQLLEDAETSEFVRSACTIYLGYMGDSRVKPRLRLGYSSPISAQNLGYVIALANLNEVDAMSLLRDELLNPKDEYSALGILGCTRNCSQFDDCDSASDLVSRIGALLFDLRNPR